MWTPHFTPRIMDHEAVPVWTNDRLLCHETHPAPILRPLPRRLSWGGFAGHADLFESAPWGSMPVAFFCGCISAHSCQRSAPGSPPDFNLCFPEGESSGASSQVFCSHWTVSSVKQLLKPSGHLFFSIKLFISLSCKNSLCI